MTKAAGLKGDVRVQPLNRYFSEYLDERALFLGFSRELVREVHLRRTTGRGRSISFHFEGVETRDQAESLIGQTLFAPVGETDPINCVSPDLIGAQVSTGAGIRVGRLIDILALPMHEVYVIDTGCKEVLIPVVPEIVQSVDLENSRIVIKPMEGLME